MKKKTNSYRENLKSRSKDARIVRRIVAVIILLLLGTFITVGYYGYDYVSSALAPVDEENHEAIEIEVPLGSSVSDIATILEENEIIQDARIFRFYVKFKNYSDFQAGDYTFTKAFTLEEIIQSLQSGRIIAEPVYTITIPEGKNIEEMAEIYADKLPFTEEEFIKTVNDDSYIEELMEKYSILLGEEILDDEIHTPLEGYLFAATYNFYEESPPVETVVENMLDKSLAVLSEYIDDIYARDFTVHETFTFASLLEMEAKTEEQRQTIAGVFYNRLADGMRLQTDPTVLYALGEHKDRVLYEDLEVDSPYNTYRIPALPIGPIANFGESSLQAVLEPTESDYMYFLHDSEGNIHYAETLEEHEALKKEYID